MKAMLHCGGNNKAGIGECAMSKRKFTLPKKEQFPEIYDAIFTFCQEMQE
jgi:hypothetical protein